jgi:peroxin-2
MEKSVYVSRVNQLDAYLLDKEIVKIIHDQLSNAYKELPPGLLGKFQPEIDALLKTLIWLNSIYFNKSTFGQQILAITYQKNKLTRNRMILHYLLTIIAPYSREVGHMRLTSNLHIQKAISWIEFCVKLCTIINFFRFLKTGQYPSVLDYFLRWNHTSEKGAQMRNFGYAYMNRELVWTGFLVRRDNYYKTPMLTF